jgi:CHAT domain-containing protein/predicted negative regulator of RcsB-dependent stress response
MKLPKLRSLILSIFLFFLSLQIALSFPVDSLQRIEQGKKLYEAEQFQDAAKIWQEVANDFATQGDPLNQIMALSNLSLSQQKLGKWSEATQNINNSLKILQNLKKTPEKQQILAATLDIQGQLQLSIGQPSAALETWQQAADVYQEIGDRNSITKNQINQAQAMQDLGLYPRACDILLTTLDIEHQDCEISTKELEKLSQTATPTQILGLRSLGNVLRVVGQIEQSQQVLLISGQLAQQIGDTQNLAAIYLSLGNTARALGSREKHQDINLNEPVECLISDTVHFYQKAAACYRKAESFPTTQIQAQLNLLSLSLETQQSEVSTLISEIQTNLAEEPPSQTSISAHLKLAQNLICLRTPVNSTQPVSPIVQQCPVVKPSDQVPSWQEIERLVTVALSQAKQIENRQATANALGYLGEIQQQIGNVTQAQQFTEQALQLLSGFNSSHLTYLWQWQLGYLYQIQGKTNDAIGTYTLAFENLQSLRGDLITSNPDLQFTFRDSVEPVYRELVDLLLQSQTPSQENLNLARNVIEALQLAELNNFFQEACLDAKPQLIEQLDPHAAIIYPIILAKRLTVILSLPQQPLRYYTTVLKSEDIERTYDELFADLNPFISSPNPLRPHQKFYDWLIRPAQTELEKNGIKTLVFVLDGVLRNVPMAALHNGQQYLIEQYNVVLTPGLQLLNPRSFSHKDLKTLVGGLSEARLGFSSLPGVRQEVQEISQIVPTKVLLDGEFTSESLKAANKTTLFPVVHLATHGQFSSQAENTFLLTWNERINVKDVDQLLQERSQTPIELLVLSACQTAFGDKRAALGLAGVAVRSGARSTLATLWSVQDQSTADLMTRFYVAFNQPDNSKAEALRQAQLSLLRSSQYQHPYYWAPFVLVGNWL